MSAEGGQRGPPSSEKKLYSPNLRYHSTTAVTAVKRIRLTMLNARQTISGECNASGAIKTKHVHTPTAHGILRSFEDLLFMTLTIRGIFHRGNTIAAISAIVFVILYQPPFAERFYVFGAVFILTK